MAGPAAAYALYALYTGIAALIAACGNKIQSSPGTDFSSPTDTLGATDVPPADSIGLPGDIDAKTSGPDATGVFTDTVVPDIPTSADVFVDAAPDGGQAVTDCSAHFPLKGTVTLFATAPCSSNAVITDMDDNGLGICTDFQKAHRVFLLKDGMPDKILVLDKVPDQVDGTPNASIAVTAMDGTTYAHGILLMYGLAETPQWLPFTPVTVDLKKFTPTFGKGVLFFGTDLFVTTSNIDFSKGKPAYSPGSVLDYAVAAKTYQAMATKGLNPTSIGAWSDAAGDHLVVVNTGPLDPELLAGSKSRLAVFDAAVPQFQKVMDLPFGGLGVAGELSIVGGRLAIPSADNSRRIVVLNTSDLAAAPQVVTAPNGPEPKGAHFISFARIFGHYLLAGNFNTGLLSTWDLNDTPPSSVGDAVTVDKQLTDMQGISDAVCLGGKLLVAVGPNLMEVK